MLEDPVVALQGLGRGSPFTEKGAESALEEDRSRVLVQELDAMAAQVRVVDEARPWAGEVGLLLQRMEAHELLARRAEVMQVRAQRLVGEVILELRHLARGEKQNQYE